MFEYYISNPERLPKAYEERLKTGSRDTEDKYRVVCDYIAGMTDRYALDEYIKLFNPYERMK